MSLERGFLKYVVMTPLTAVGFASMYVYGGVIFTFLNSFKFAFSGNFMDALLEYFFYSALPPTSIEHVFLQVAVGTLAAGIKWYIAMSKIRSRSW
jgi:hypothetical protein